MKNTVIEITPFVFVILLSVWCVIGWLLHRKKQWRVKYWVIPLFGVYILMLAGITLFPIHLYNSETLARIREGMGKYMVFYQAVPFASIANYFRSETFIQLAGNVLLLVPLALFVKIFLRQRPKAWKVAAAVPGVSVGIELFQLATNYLTGYPARVADVDDWILNTTGAVLTILFARWIGKREKPRALFGKLFYRA